RCLRVVGVAFLQRARYAFVRAGVEGVSLPGLLAARGAPGLSPPEVAEYVSQTAAALDHPPGHEPPVVHQDVKPGNLILVPDGHVVLVDCGLSVPGGTERPGRYGGAPRGAPPRRAPRAAPPPPTPARAPPPPGAPRPRAPPRR